MAAKTKMAARQYPEYMSRIPDELFPIYWCHKNAFKYYLYTIAACGSDQIPVDTDACGFDLWFL